jgi:hypothetical protein
LKNGADYRQRREQARNVGFAVPKRNNLMRVPIMGTGLASPAPTFGQKMKIILFIEYRPLSILTFTGVISYI